MFLSSIKIYLKKNKLKLILLFILITINILVYFPSFFHIARHDQILYIGSMTGDNSWISLAVKKAVNYNRDEHIFAGYSPPLFRPLFYFILGTELWFFQYNFTYWQITGLLFHLAVLWFFLNLLFQIRKSIFAALFVLFFSVLFANIEMVIWHHISSYMIAVACTLICIQIFYEIIRDKQVTNKQTWVLFTSLLIACFIYETAFLFSIFLFLLSKFLLRPQANKKYFASRHWKIMVLSPAIIYLCFNCLSFFLKWNAMLEHQYPPAREPFLFIKTLKAIFLSFSWWCSAGLFPNLLKPLIAQRITFHNQAFLNPQNIFSIKNILSLNFLSLTGSIFAYIIIFVKTLSKKFLKQKSPFILLVLGLWFIQVALLGIVRVSVSGVNLLVNCGYYNYFFWPYPLIILYALIDFDKLSKNHLMRALKVFSFICFSLLIVANASKTFKLNLNCAKTWKDQYLLMKKSKKLIKAHNQENDFSFIVNPRNALTLPWIHKEIVAPTEEPYSYVEMFYPALTKKDNPKYIVRLTNKERQESLQAYLEALTEYQLEYPFESWNLSGLKPVFSLIALYKKQGQEEKALRIINRLQSSAPHNKHWQAFLKSQIGLLP